jgi:hypothetical protein
MMIELEVKPVHDSSAPGWWIDLDDALFIVWAPSGTRPNWAACWETWDPDPADPELVLDGSENGRFVRGDSLDEVLSVFEDLPDGDLGTRVRRLLSGAAREAATTEPGVVGGH